MLETFSPAMRLLLSASYRGVLFQIGKEPGSKEALDLNVDWHEFQQLVHRHGVVNHVLVGLKGCDIPESVSEGLQGVARRSAIIGLGQLSEVNRLCTVLKEAEIDLLPIKGVRLSQRLYGSPSFRFSSDIDLLVSAENLYAAQSLLLSQGYELQRYRKPFTLEQTERLATTSAIHLNFSHPDNNLEVELHWRLFVNRYYLPLAEQFAITERALKRRSKDEEDAFVTDDLLLYLILHGSNHAWSRLRWLLDIAAIANKEELAWDSWVQSVNDFKLRRPVGQVFLLLNAMFDLTTPAPIYDLIKNETTMQTLVSHVYKTWQGDQTYKLRHGMQTRAMLKQDWAYRYDEARRAWSNPLKFPFWNLPDTLFPINSILSMLIQFGRIFSNKE